MTTKKSIAALVLALSFLLNATTSCAALEMLTDDNIRIAVRLWLSNETLATTTFGHISDWNVSLVTDMTVLFAPTNNFPADTFNDDISNWDTSSVTTMAGMFDEASSFNGNISLWNVSSVESMFGMFARALKFNQHLDQWDVSNVQDMNAMFVGAKAFNGNISTWDTSTATSMLYMFRGAESFDQVLCWDLAGSPNTTGMFCLNELAGFDDTCVAQEFIAVSRIGCNAPTRAPTQTPEATLMPTMSGGGKQKQQCGWMVWVVLLLFPLLQAWWL